MKTKHAQTWIKTQWRNGVEWTDRDPAAAIMFILQVIALGLLVIIATK